MIIKLQRSNQHSDYLILENISHINYFTKPVDASLYKGAADESTHWWYSGTTELLNKIECQRDGKDLTLLFDGEAFICNDDGKTVQRVNPLPPVKVALCYPPAI